MARHTRGRHLNDGPAKPDYSKQDTKQVIKNNYDNFMKGIADLEKRIAQGESDEKLEATRKRLGSSLWNLKCLYGYEFDEAKLKLLGVVPSMGTVIPRGQTGRNK